ncbi:MAG: hypothetical protein HY903_19230 [Deltaproteobacteria bacterium]|nr:hypothetical protein [Deltaproteobacteria bacterium]
MSSTTPHARPATSLIADLVDKNARAAAGAAKMWIDGARFAAYSTHALLEGGVFPAFDGVLAVNDQVLRSVLEVLRGERSLGDLAKDTSARAQAAVRFPRLVQSMGKELFGSATFAGETVLGEDAHFRLTYIPPVAAGEGAGVAIFHAGGAIPYGDRIFRMLPDFNFYAPFLARGVAVYAMELKGDRSSVDFGSLTVESLIASLDRLSALAFTHHGRRKMILEGYCGQGTQALLFAAARPKEADARFSALALFVAPVDGSKCEALATAMQRTPDRLLDANLTLWGLLGGYLPGDATRLGIDMPLKAVFYKTPLAYLLAGWHRSDWAEVQRIEDLSGAQRRDLAGAYWVSADNANRFPIPVELARATARLFKRGIAANGDLPLEVEGRRLSLATVAAATQLKVFGFYGGRDPVVPDRTAHPLITLLGRRYTHVVHPEAGHVSYVLSPKVWDAKDARGLRPNPIDLLLQTQAATSKSRRAEEPS